MSLGNLEESLDYPLGKVLPSPLLLGLVRRLRHAGSRHEVDVGQWHIKAPFPRVNLPEHVKTDDDEGSQVALEEHLGVGFGVRRWLFLFLSVEDSSERMYLFRVYIYV